MKALTDKIKNNTTNLMSAKPTIVANPKTGPQARPKG